MLFLVPTPIGNLQDISLRAIQILKEVNYIYAEDTRVFKKLRKSLNIKTTNNIYSFNLINENNKDQEIINLLKENKKVALVSDAGTPLISDPGYPIINKAIKENIEVIPISGACSVIMGLIKSGLETNDFRFFGYLKLNKSKTLKEQINNLKEANYTSIFFVTKYELDKIDTILTEHFNNRECCLVKEISKMNEKAYYGRGNQIISTIPIKERRGEFLLIVGRARVKDNNNINEEELIKLTSIDTKTREKAKIIGKLLNKDSKDIYGKIMKNK